MVDIRDRRVKTIVAFSPGIDHDINRKVHQRDGEPQQPGLPGMGDEVVDGERSKAYGWRCFFVQTDDRRADLRIGGTGEVAEVRRSALRRCVRIADHTGREVDTEVFCVLAIAAGGRNVLRVAITDPQQSLDIGMPTSLCRGRSNRE